MITPFSFVALVLGGSHECRILGDCGIVFIRYGKREFVGWRDFYRRLRKELTSGDSED